MNLVAAIKSSLLECHMPDKKRNLGHLESGADLYRKIPYFAETRRKELSIILNRVISLAHSYGSLVARAVWALGNVPPKSRQDVVVRDLIADVFDFLYEWPRPLLEGRLHVAFPLARRAYESLALLAACFQDASIAERWDQGEQIGNAEIRKALSKMPFPESEESLKDLYKFFSKATHPNRDLIAERFLGDGNRFVLGSITQSGLLLVLDHSMHLVDMWFWFGSVVGFIAKEPLEESDPSFFKDYFATARKAAEIKKWLGESFNKLLEKEQASLRTD